MRLFRLPASRQSDFGKVVGIAALVVLALELTYLLAGNVLLRAGVIEHWLNTDPNELEVHFDGAWTVFPGRVRLKNFSMREQDDNVQVWLRIERATVDVELFDLFKRRFHASRVTTQGTSFRRRQKLRGSAADRLRATAYPPIAGFTDPPLLPRVAPRQELGIDPWTIQIENVEADLSELWVMQFRYSGRAIARGQFRLMPGKRLRVGPASVEFSPGKLTAGEKEIVASSVRGNISCTIDDFDVRASRGWHTFDHVRASVWLRAAITNLGFTRLYLDPKLRLSEGAGELDLAVKIEHGNVRPKSHVRYQTKRVALATRRIKAHGDANVQLEVHGAERSPVAMLRMSAANVSLAGTDEFARLPPARVRGASMELSSRAFAIPGTWQLASGRFAVPSFELEDLRLLNTFIDDPEDLQIRGGSAVASAVAAIAPDGVLKAEAKLKTSRGQFVVNRAITVLASGTASARLVQKHANQSRGAFDDFRLDMNPVYISTKDGATGNGWVRIDDATIPYEKFSPQGIRALVRGGFPDAKPVFAALGMRLKGIPKFAASLLDTSNLRATVDLVHEAELTDVHLRDAQTEGLRGYGRWRRDGKRSRGAFLLVMNVGRLGVTVQNAESDVDLFVGMDWLGKELARLGLARDGT